MQRNITPTLWWMTVFPDTQRCGRASGSGDGESKSLTALRGGEGSAQVHGTRRVLAPTAVQNMATCPTFSWDFQHVWLDRCGETRRALRRHRYQAASTFSEMMSNEWPQADCLYGHQSKSESCTFIVKVLTNQRKVSYKSLTTFRRVTALPEKFNIL